MATQHTIGVFEPSKESWVSYIERLEQFFIATDVATNEKKRAILLSGCGLRASGKAGNGKWRRKWTRKMETDTEWAVEYEFVV